MQEWRILSLQIHILYKEIMFKISKGYDHVTKTVRLPEPMAEKLENLAAKNSLSFNQLIIQCIQFALDNISSKEHTN